MKTPPGLQALLDDGIVDEVVRQLKSGKEASVYVVRTGTVRQRWKTWQSKCARSTE